jgi:YesN/AraC family two-component response regulator
MEYIKEHLSENLTVKDTAKALTVNANYLSSQFHQHMGIPFIDFVNRERVQQAASLLSSTHLQIQQISQFVGYNNTSYFAKQFTKFMGVSPRQYRQLHNPRT